MMFDWLRRKTRQPSLPPLPRLLVESLQPAVTPVELPLTPMGKYAQEFAAACERSSRIGVQLAPIQLSVRKDCLNAATLAPLLQEFVGQYSEDEVVGQALPITSALIPFLLKKTGTPFLFTLGWFEHGHRRMYEHGDELIGKLLKEGIAACPAGFPAHVWLTSPAMEILDVTLPTTIANISNNRHLSGSIIYYSNQEASPEFVFHPTVVGEDFLVKIGAAINVGAHS